MANIIRDNNAFEDEFWRTHNPYKLTPHIDYLKENIKEKQMQIY